MVTQIQQGAFYRSGVKKVVIPNSVTSIGTGAFYGSKLEKVVIPSSVLKIGYKAFMDTKLSSVILPNKQVKFQSYSDTFTDRGDWGTDYTNAFSCSVTR